MRILDILTLFLILFRYADAYNFLVVCPIFAYSHIKFMSKVADTLVNGGHSVVNSGIGKNVPIFGDQLINAKMLSRHGGSIAFNKYKLENSEELSQVIREALCSSAIRSSAQRLAEILRNQPVDPKTNFLRHAEFSAKFGRVESLQPYNSFRMEISNGDGGEETQNDSRNSILGETAGTSKPEADVETEEMVVEAVVNIGVVETSVDTDSPRASLPPAIKQKANNKKKRKRSSSEDSSLPEAEARGAEDGVNAPLSNVNKEINVGPEYQAKIVEDFNDPNYMDGPDTEEVLIWEASNETLEKEKLRNWVTETSARFLIPTEAVLFLLKFKKFNYDEAYKLISTRPEINETWSEEESLIFERCFSNFGKNFSSIHSGLCHRSIRSIVKHYYSSKKWIKYKQFSSSKHNDSRYDDDEAKRIIPPASFFVDMCENCGQRAENMELVQRSGKTPRGECRPCVIYYRKMGVPRPTNLRMTLSERLYKEIRCPNAYRMYMKDFERMMEPANGETLIRRKMGKSQTVEDIIGPCDYYCPSPNPRNQNGNSNGTCTPLTSNEAAAVGTPPVEEAKPEELVDSAGVQKGSEQSVEELVSMEISEQPPARKMSSAAIEIQEYLAETREILAETKPESVQKPEDVTVDPTPESNPPETSQSLASLPVNIWCRKKTLCQEEIEVLAEDGRRKMYDAVQLASRVNQKDVESMKTEMSAMRNRMERMRADVDLTPSFVRNNNKMTYDGTWSDRDQTDVVRLFKWYGLQFKQIGDILGTKSAQHVRDYYRANKAIIDSCIAEHKEMMCMKVACYEESRKQKDQI
ncbi:hypothetical protein L5515_005839 [Caenorhabditis briggsae]|uniref:Glucuronosyltransferase n=2 Tax=Caenorhabditis briggsae TaxID=6238 RepID=A0AAE9EZ00_CAEBR|nr:hypothetical protein L5515_005839 [Caenorhabditis briggsae]